MNWNKNNNDEEDLDSLLQCEDCGFDILFGTKCEFCQEKKNKRKSEDDFDFCNLTN